MTTLIDYLRAMLDRHPHLAYSYASTEAGLNINAIGDILNGKSMKPKPSTLKALADKWGEPGDYEMLFSLAGYAIPKTKSDLNHGQLDIINKLERENVSEAEMEALGEILTGAIKLIRASERKNESLVLGRASPQKRLSPPDKAKAPA
jgi:transcriptional regulator with XRE-family HTH domain